MLWLIHESTLNAQVLNGWAPSLNRRNAINV
jgi:hypothetical protein